MSQSVTIEDLRKVIAFKDLPDEHLEWIISRSEVHEYHDGDLMHKYGESIDEMWITLEGKAYFYMNVNGRLVFYFSFENNELTGGVGGILPYSRMKKAPGNTYAVGKVKTLNLHKKYFHELEHLNPDFIQKLIGYMTERARVFATTQMQQEKVSALGKLAAGIAHELNNPASAISRISSELNKRLRANFDLTEELLKHKVSHELIRNIRDMVLSKGKSEPPVKKMSSMERLEKEDEMNEWLTSKDCGRLYEVTETFVEAGISINDLEKISRDFGDEALPNIIYWLENILNSELIIKDLENASGHISTLVGAIKSHVRMDRSGDIHKTNIHENLENTLILLEYKIRDKHIKVKKQFCSDMPEVEAYIGELNQVWTNIIDNAIYAVPLNGEIIIETSCDQKNVNVCITDNGSGIPKEIQSRIFDPFFTTKKVGEGTGIGLDIVQNVIKRHNGEVKVNSKPGRTEFIVTFPVSQKLINEEIKDEVTIHNNH
jgi:signal transduction histidine kinase